MVRSSVFLVTAALTLASVACTSATGAGPNDAVNSAVNACSDVGVSGDLATCEARAREAERSCARLEGSKAAGCRSYVDGLRVAAVEAYHLGRGECGELTSDQARALCRSGEPPSAANPTTTAPVAVTTQAPAPVLVPIGPPDDDHDNGNEGPGNRNDGGNEGPGNRGRGGRGNGGHD